MAPNFQPHLVLQASTPNDHCFRDRYDPADERDSHMSLLWSPRGTVSAEVLVAKNGGNTCWNLHYSPDHNMRTRIISAISIPMYPDLWEVHGHFKGFQSSGYGWDPDQRLQRPQRLRPLSPSACTSHTRSAGDYDSLGLFWRSQSPSSSHA